MNSKLHRYISCGEFQGCTIKNIIRLVIVFRYHDCKYNLLVTVIMVIHMGSPWKSLIDSTAWTPATCQNAHSMLSSLPELNKTIQASWWTSKRSIHVQSYSFWCCVVLRRLGVVLEMLLFKHLNLTSCPSSY